MINEEMVIQIIANGGNGRSQALTAVKQARKGLFSEAKASLKEAEAALGQAHKAQTSLIQAEARGEAATMSLLMVHAQDHLMNAMTVLDLANELVAILEENKLGVN